MAFQTAITVVEAVKRIIDRSYLLPAIQREFVWSEEQIERLFDSIMRGYPIGSFLFWKVSRENLKNYQFYEFIKDYHQMKSHNQKATLMGDENITAILDGQQRLTALYIGLKGSYASKVPYMHWDNPQAFPQKKLYLNLLDEPGEDEEMLYQFKFLTDEKAQERNEHSYWFPVGKILDFNPDNPFELHEYLTENNLTSKYAGKCLFRLSEVINKNAIISYYLEEGQELDRVLNIFIRVNSGGTLLSYSDLLLSIATAQWENRDAREEITSLVDEINRLGSGFTFDKDFVLKTCLVLCDKDIKFKVDNFNSRNMLDIENQWDKIREIILATVELVSGFGFNYQTLTSHNAIIPICYYLFQRGKARDVLALPRYAGERETMRKWLHLVLLKQTFGGQSDEILRIIREVIRDHHTIFPADEIKARLKRMVKTLELTEEEIDNLLENQYGKKYTFSVLALLYPSLNYRYSFHQDHIHPRSLCSSRDKLRRAGIPDNDIDFILQNYNKIPNLQLLEGAENISKKDRPFVDWLDETYPDAVAREQFKERHFLTGLDLSLNNFSSFYENRKKALKNALKQTVL
ncbi:DUF262 domain-containing protein [Moorella sp. Hama-1]|uniref:DUF262 domain-containing protein n=1 Tax=Moorella sp. Hama-1 TaxID=2138101 RepID=UPI000D659BCB|nr:DUF262 domain-containing protein [Moorella sp. Hama-1]BCV20220.1 hypothetical protein hamaS1_02890 [Moorella sp. Hama-1]